MNRKAWHGALVAAFIAACSYLAPVVDDGLKASEAIGAASAAVAAGAAVGGIVWKTENR